MDRPRLPEFPFTPPVGYRWLIERGLVGFTPSSALLPWYYVSREEGLALGPALRRGLADDGESIFAFARREDTDDVACMVSRDNVVKIALVHTWTPTGPEVVATYDTIWDWLRAVVDDIEEVVAAASAAGSVDV